MDRVMDRVMCNADVRVEIADDGMFLGFFTEDGRTAVVNLEMILAALPEGSVSRSALREWQADRMRSTQTKRT